MVDFGTDVGCVAACNIPGCGPLPWEQDIDASAEFAKDKLAQATGELFMDDIYDEWRIGHAPSDNALAIQAALGDLHNRDVPSRRGPGACGGKQAAGDVPAACMQFSQWLLGRYAVCRHS